MQSLIEDFLQHLRHEKGHSELTQKTYATMLGKFVAWANDQGISDWKSVTLSNLMSFLTHERSRVLAGEPKDSTRRLSSESVYLEIAALRAVYRYAENEKLLPTNLAENLSLPRRWKRLPKSLSDQEINKLLEPELPEIPGALCDQAVLELAYSSGLRLAELRNARLEQLHLEAGFISVIGKGNKERVVPLGRKAAEALKRYLETGRPSLVTARSPAAIFLTRRGTPSNSAPGAPASKKMSPHICFGTALPHICWNMERTCASFRNCSVTPRLRLPRFIRTWPEADCERCIGDFIRDNKSVELENVGRRSLISNCCLPD